MPILLILFSDIHLSSDKDPVLSRITSIKNVLRDRLDESNDDIWIIISGDITYSGKATEFELAKCFFSDFEKEIRSVKQSVRPKSTI